MSSARFKFSFFILRLITDFVISFYIIIFAYKIRFEIYPEIYPLKYVAPIQNYFLLAVIYTFINLIVFAIFGLYSDNKIQLRIDEIFQIGKAVTISFIIMMASTFIYREVSYSRLIFAYSWILSFFVIGLSRITISYFEKNLLLKGYGIRKTVIIGKGSICQPLIDKFLENPGSGYALLGYIEEDEKDKLAKVPLLGPLDEYESILNSMRVDEVIIALSHHKREKIQQIVDTCDKLNIECRLLPDTLSYILTPTTISEFKGIPLIKAKRMKIRGFNAILKRAMDISISFILLIVLSPLFLIISIIIRLDSSGGAIYIQDRMGMDGIIFKMYKFRTMVADAEKDTGPIWPKENDPRTTKVGKFLRKYNFDELPQLFNILKGEMSLIGPRPERPFFVQKFQKGIPRYMERHKVKSGLTGWAQVNGLRGDTSIYERTQYDLYYIENWSIFFDIKIIILTILQTLGEIFGIKSNKK